MKIAVYGTLRRGFGNNRLLSGASFLGKGRTLNKGVMVASGIPYVVLGKGPQATRIVVEVYEVDPPTLRRLDALEGHPAWYRRTPVAVNVGGRTMRAELYAMPFPPANSRVVPSGDYADYGRP